MTYLNRLDSLGRSARASFLFTALAAALTLTPGCAPKQEPLPEGTTSGTAASAGGADGTASTTATAEADFPTTLSIEHTAEPPPAGVNIPFPDADVALDITPARRGGTFTYSSFGEGPKSFNPITSNDSSSGDVIGLMFSSLIGFDAAEQKYEPALAKEWTMNPEDKRVWTVKLREGIKWSDGQPLTADDVIFTVNTIYDTRYLSAIRDIMQVNGEPLKFEKVDDHTVKVTLPAPTASFRTMMSFPIIPKHAYEEIVKNGTFDEVLSSGVDPAKLVVSGPFKLKLYQSGERVILERNPNYWRFDKTGTQLPYLDTFIISYAPDMNQMLLRFTGKQADGVSGLPPDSIADLRTGQQAGNYTLFDLGPGMATNLFWYNLKPGVNPTSGKPYVAPEKLAIFSDPRFRKASLHAINRPAIIRTILRGLAVEATGKESPANKFWYNPNVEKYPYDPARAKALLDEMGLKEKPGEKTRVDAQGRPVTFTIITNKGNTVREQVVSLIAQDLRAVGIDARTQVLDFNALLQQTDVTYEYDASLLGLTGGGVDPASGMNAYLSSGRTNLYNPRQEKPFTEWQAEIDRLAKEMVASLEIARQRELYFKIQEISADLLPVLPLWHGKVFVAARNTFGNLRPSVMSPNLIWNADEFFSREATGSGGGTTAQPASTPAQPAATPAVTPAATPAETPAATPAATPAETPAATPQPETAPEPPAQPEPAKVDTQATTETK